MYRQEVALELDELSSLRIGFEIWQQGLLGHGTQTLHPVDC